MGSESSKLQASESFKSKDEFEIKSQKRKPFSLKGKKKFLSCIYAKSFRLHNIEIRIPDDVVHHPEEQISPTQISSSSELSLVKSKTAHSLDRPCWADSEPDIPKRSTRSSILRNSWHSLKGVSTGNTSSNSTPYSRSRSNISASYRASLSSDGHDPYLRLGTYTLIEDTPNQIETVEAAITPQQGSNQPENSSEFTEVKLADGQNFKFENFEFCQGCEGIKVAVNSVSSQESSAAEYGVVISKIIHLAPHGNMFSSPVDFNFILPNDSSFSNIDVLYSPTEFMEESRWEVLEKYQDDRRLVYCDGGPLHNYVLYEETDQYKRLRFLLRHFCSFVVVKKGEKCRLEKVFVYTLPVYENEIDVAVLAGKEDLMRKHYDEDLKCEGFSKMVEREVKHYENGGNFKIQIKISGLKTEQNSSVYDAEVELDSTILCQSDFDYARFPYNFSYKDRGRGVPIDVVLRQEKRTDSKFLSFRQILSITEPESKISCTSNETDLKKIETLEANAAVPDAPVDLRSDQEAKSIVHNYNSECGSHIPCSNKTTTPDGSYYSGCTRYAQVSSAGQQKLELKEEDIESGLGDHTATKSANEKESAKCIYENVNVFCNDNVSGNNGPDGEMDSGNMACGGYERENIQLNDQSNTKRDKSKSQMGVPEDIPISSLQSQKAEEWEDAEEVVRSLDLRSTSY